MADGVRVRQARADDVADVAAFTEDTWSESDRGDYIPDVFADWVGTDGDDQHTVVARDDGAAVGCCQAVRCSAHEAWTQGMRIHPDRRGEGVARALDRACRDWARDRGATVVRNMVFSWNEAGLGTARSLGYRPRAELRWAHPDPDADATTDADVQATAPEWMRERTRRAAEKSAVLAVGDDPPRGVAWRTRVTGREGDRVAVYGGTVWDDLAAARDLFGAVADDAAAVDADRTRALLPETPHHVTEAAAAGVELADHPDFVLEGAL